MARGRMVTNSISKDKDIHELSNDTCRLLFTWLLTFADVEGRVHGDPAVVRSTVFPRRTDISVEQIEGYLTELAEAGLILRYTDGNDQFILFPAFDKNQPGLRKDREPASELPPPPSAAIEEYVRKFTGRKPDVCRTISRLREVEVEEKRSRREVEGDGGSDPADEIPDTAYKSLEAAFVKATGLTIPMGGGIPTQKWVQSFREMLAEGVTAEDITQACAEMAEKDYSIAGPRSIRNGVRMVIAKRNGKSSKKPAVRNPGLRARAGMEDDE